MVRPLKRGAAFVARDGKGAVLLVKRPDKGLLASMLEPPQGAWGEAFPSRDTALKQAPFKARWQKRPGLVRHGFTHFELEVEVYFAEVSGRPKLTCHPRRAARQGRAAREGGPGKKNRRVRKALDSLPSALRASPGMTSWVHESELHSVALPTVMRKIVEHGLDSDGPLFSQTNSARSR